MGRLYDKQDLAWNLDFWNRQEQRIHKDIANGLQRADVLDVVIHIPASKNSQRPGRCFTIRESFDLKRQQERMKLLRTGQLLSELDYWRKRFRACPHCYQTIEQGKTRDVACDAHRDGLKAAKGAVYWAGEYNLLERSSRGQVRAEVIVTAEEALAGIQIDEHNGQLNKWEEAYLHSDWRRVAVVEPTYKNFLEMLLHTSQMPAEAYSAELQRLRQEEMELEQGDNKPARLPHCHTDNLYLRMLENFHARGGQV